MCPFVAHYIGQTVHTVCNLLFYWYKEWISKFVFGLHWLIYSLCIVWHGSNLQTTKTSNFVPTEPSMSFTCCHRHMIRRKTRWEKKNVWESVFMTEEL